MRYYLLLLLWLVSPAAGAQNPYYINYTIPDGLPSENVYSVFQDENGWLWFTTDVGIVKYDSKSFELFNTDNGLSDNEVFRLSQDSKGRIWMHTLNGKLCYIYRNRIYNEQNSPLLRQIKGSSLVVDFYEVDGKVYISFRSGEIFVIDHHDRIERKTNKPPHWGVWKNGIMYAIYAGTVVELDNGTEIQTLDADPQRNLFNTQMRLWHLGSETYLSSGNELFILKQGKPVSYLHVDKTAGITNVCKIDNNMWVATRSGLYQYEGSRVVNHFFKDDAISDVLKDREGNFWVTTLNRGVLMIPSMNVLRLLENKKIHRLGLNGSELWLGGTENNCYTLKKEELSNYYLPKDWPADKITCFHFYGNDAYIGVKTGIVISGKSETKYFKINVNDLLYSHDHLYIATSYTARIHKDNISAHIVHTPDSNKIIAKRTNALEEDDKGNIWIGTNFGLYLYTSEANGPKLYNMGEQVEELAISIEDIFFDNAESTMLVGTASRGLVVLKDRKVVKVINTQNGLNNNTVTAIKKIDGNTYLVGSNNGLNKIVFPGNDDNVENYNFRVGLNKKRINDIELLNGIAYLATDNGVLYFEVERMKPSNVYPICNISAVKTDKGLYRGEQINYTDNDVSISFSGISFKDKGHVEYYYRFAGKDKTWNTTWESQVNYQDLAPGKYTFEVFCKNGLGNNSKVRSVSFEILPPFWQKPWFVVLCGVLVAGMIYLYHRSRLKAQQRKNEAEKKNMQIEKERVQLEKQMLELEQKALRMQMNPHFIFNALNTIKGYYSEGDDIMAGNYIAKFSKLLRMLLNTEGQNTSLDNEIEMLRLYVELTRIRYHEKFSYVINVDPGLMSADTIIPSLLLQPIVENAIVHGLAPKTGKGKLLVLFEREGDEMICTVEDNGIGRKHAAELRSRNPHTSKAISIVQDRLRLFDESSSFEIIDIEEQGKPAGTKVIIKLPIKFLALENATD